MSVFDDLILPKIIEIPKTCIINFNNDLENVFECLDKFAEDKNKSKGLEKPKQNAHVISLQSIQEDGDGGKKQNEESSDSYTDSSNPESSKPVGSKKRSKNEVDGMSSPELDKRQKRNASVKAQGKISKQVNVNLSQKMRRSKSIEKSKSRKQKDNAEKDKENNEPVIKIKQEKISEPSVLIMDSEILPLNPIIKQDICDDIAMPPPSMPLPKQRKGAKKDKVIESEDEKLETERATRRTTRSKKETDTTPLVPSNRTTRSSTRNVKQTEQEEEPVARPKRTRGKKVQAEPESQEVVESVQNSDVELNSPTQKPRPKRTRRNQKAAEEKLEADIAETHKAKANIVSPVLQTHSNKTKPNDINGIIKTTDPENNDTEKENKKSEGKELEKTILLSTVDGSNMDQTIVLQNGVYSHDPVTPKNINLNETVLIESQEKNNPQPILDATVVINRDSNVKNLTDDNSLLTDDDSQEVTTPPSSTEPVAPSSAVKKKVQQFEEMASRVTRNKTRALNKYDGVKENSTPESSKMAISAEMLANMNNIIFNGKPAQISQSASRIRVPPYSKPPTAPSSASKVSGLANKADEVRRDWAEDPRKKKEAMLDAKREAQRRKREEKMAAAAAARIAADKERQAVLMALAKDRQEKQLHADLGKMEKLKLVEKKKQELARKVLETEERRRAEELARHQRLEQEQKKAEENRKKQIKEVEVTKKEAAQMAREIEQRQREFKMKCKAESRMTPIKAKPPIEPAYMLDGFQYLHSDEEADLEAPPNSGWSTKKNRARQLTIQSQIAAVHIDHLFSVREQTPDLSEIFPNIDRGRLKRTSSAVWRTPPGDKLG
ncbi:inner centromere protein B isoform X2 [Leptidea sinapis]|uniref:inner centromere protein B isoform X2 n=1 Tax=Leptidea sinapis TaxID=189913 RepID=UPI0021C3AAAC|nr:inner centromere protein B isoform X2 [Leptidea sinapis]